MSLETLYILHVLNSKMVVGLSCVDALLIVEILKYCLQCPIHCHTILKSVLEMHGYTFVPCNVIKINLSEVVDLNS